MSVALSPRLGGAMRRIAGCALLATAVGCLDPAPLVDDPNPNAPSDPAAGAPSSGPQPLRRLSSVEYESTLRDLFGDAAVDAVRPALASVPSDRAPHQFSTMSLGITSQLVEGYFAV